MREHRRSTPRLLTAALAAGLLAGAALTTTTATAPAVAAPQERPSVQSLDTLRDWAPRQFRIGTAVAGGGHHTSADYPEPFPSDPTYRAFLADQFSSLTPENQMKWNHIHPEPDRYDFEQADAIVDFAERNGQVVRGHTLFWHSQNPTWLEQGDHSPEELRAILREHVETVVGRYAGRIQQWDVANEIFDDAGQLRTEDNIWIRELGPGIVADVFRWTHEADPQAELFFNDYNVEGPNAKSDAYHALIQQLLADGVPVHGFGMQAHLGLQYGFDGRMQENLQRFDDLGLATAVTEIDIRGPVGEDGQLSPELRQRQADWYAAALEACLAVEGCRSFTIWGVLDEHSWVPGTFPGQGDALTLEGDYQRKPAYCALQETLATGTGRPGRDRRWERISPRLGCAADRG
ncbi:endo-1,4-beta-xylanase [Desertihabitans aurantiacus]|uniref:endo-1,4-beta-xylanase n=1 Tax=Desertihabitans aurantiacus TaxID=2282477 RepID=UPI000DF849B9|nr:endo-1,4-beta-xylanase [Desertihabitans aurantiacus]